MGRILHQATGLGVTAMMPVNGGRTEMEPDAGRAGKRLAHRREVAQACACAQCGRATLPGIAPPRSLEPAVQCSTGTGRG